MDDLQTHYEVLEIPESATKEEAYSAYRGLAKEYHPDRLVKLPEHLTKLRKDAEEKWRQIQDAWSVIGDIGKRRQYDDLLRQYRQQPDPQFYPAQSAAPQSAANAPYSPPPPPPQSPPPPPPSPPAQAPPPRPPSASPRKSIWKTVLMAYLFVGGAIALIVVAVNLWRLPEQLNGPTVGGDRAPEQIVDRDFCPYDGCRNGQRLMARSDVTIYANPPERLEISKSSLQTKGVIRTGEWITIKKDIVLSRRFRGRAIPNGIKGAKPLFAAGQEVSLYIALGHGCYRVWAESRIQSYCWVNPEAEQGRFEWWTQVETQKGETGWAFDDRLVTRERLNSELSAVIANSDISRSQKVERIDALMREGADLNGYVMKHDEAIVSAGIGTLDTDLMSMLISRGLNLKDSRHCPAYYARYHVLEPGGDLTLDFLLKHGMQLNCIMSPPEPPPLEGFLLIGVNGGQISVDRRIRIAEVLLQNGVDVNQRDSKGKSIFEALDEWIPKHPELARLKEVLQAAAH